MYSGVVFREVVGQVFRAWCPINVKLFLIDTILQPVEAHVNRLRLTLLDLLVGEADCCGVIELDGGGGLGMAHFVEGSSDLCGILGVRESGGDFRFGGGAQDLALDVGFDEDGAIGDFVLGWVVSQVEEPTGSTASFRFG